MDQKLYYVYILASKRNGTIYIGATNNLLRRVEEHKAGKVVEFTARYKVYNLVYFEQFIDIREALTREKQLKNWRRLWKIKLIESKNPGWKDLMGEV